MPLLGVREAEPWSKVIRSFAVVLTTVTAVVVGSQITAPGFVDHLPWALALALPFAAVNAAVEEGILRFVLMEGILDVPGRTKTALLSGAIFGAIHYFGVPSGVPGVAMAGLLGWFLARCVIDTRGIVLAWLSHLLQDIVIFALLFATAATVP